MRARRGALRRDQLAQRLLGRAAALQAFRDTGELPATALRSRNSSGATLISATSRSTARVTPATTCRGDTVRMPAGGFAPVSANMPASRTKPGWTIETPTPVPCRSWRSPSAKPRRPNSVPLYSDADLEAALPEREPMNAR